MNPESLQAVSLALAQERSVDAVLRSIALGLASQPGIALARVWLVGPGDIGLVADGLGEAAAVSVAMVPALLILVFLVTTLIEREED